MVRVTVTLSEDDAERLRWLGNGNASAAVRSLIGMTRMENESPRAKVRRKK
jgi:hypothetical protein